VLPPRITDLTGWFRSERAGELGGCPVDLAREVEVLGGADLLLRGDYFSEEGGRATCQVDPAEVRIRRRIVAARSRWELPGRLRCRPRRRTGREVEGQLGTEARGVVGDGHRFPGVGVQLTRRIR
jgi:hypothetical protein